MPQQKPVFSKLTPIPNLSNSDRVQRYGTTGTEYFSGYFTEEYNAEWRDEQRVDLVEKMRRGNGVISAMLKAVKSPINSTDWYLTPASDEQIDIDIKEEVERQLFNMPQRGWKEFIREALAHLEFGHYVFEKIWYMDDEGRICLKDLAPRIPHSIIRWMTSDNLPGITQFVRSDQQYEADRKYNENLSIPISKLVIFTHQKEGEDLTGIPLIRPAYTHYYYVNNLYKIQAISLERFGVGILDIEHDPSIGEDDRDEMESVAKNVYANEQSYILHSNKFKVNILSPSSSANSPFDTAINHHNRMMLLSVLAEFLDLGSGTTGSFSLSQDQSSFFLQHVGEIASYMQEVINREIIEDIVELNYKGHGKYPTIHFSPLGSIDYKEMSGVFSDLTKAGVLSSDPEIHQFVRKLFKLPEISQEKMDEIDISGLDKEIGIIEKKATKASPKRAEAEEIDEEEEGILED